MQAFRKGAEASKGGSAVAFQVSGSGRRGRSTGDGAWLTSGGRARETRLITVCCVHAIVAAGCRLIWLPTFRLAHPSYSPCCCCCYLGVVVRRCCLWCVAASSSIRPRPGARCRGTSAARPRSCSWTCCSMKVGRTAGGTDGMPKTKAPGYTSNLAPCRERGRTHHPSAAPPDSWPSSVAMYSSRGAGCGRGGRRDHVVSGAGLVRARRQAPVHALAHTHGRGQGPSIQPSMTHAIT